MTATRMILMLLCMFGMTDATEWGLVMDCGSSGTRLRMYTHEKDGSVNEFMPASKEDQAALEVQPGISSFAGNEAELGVYIGQLIDQATRWVPEAEQPKTRIRALATAGMRLLKDTVQAPIWGAISKRLTASPFEFVDGDATTISGEYEGLFNWLSNRYILEREPREGDGHFTGGLDLGGASTQITFVPANGVILGDVYRVTRNGSTARVYSHSYMRSGQDQAKQRHAQRLADADGSTAKYGVLSSPCFNRGFAENFTVSCPLGACVRQLEGTGDYHECRNHTRALLNRENECLLEPCAAHGVYQPLPSGSMLFAVSAFFYTASGIGLVGWDEEKALSTRQIEASGAEFCAKDWEVVASPYADSYCFTASYTASLFDAYSIPPDDTKMVHFARKLRGFTASWTLGAELYYRQEQRCEIASGMAPPAPPAPSSCDDSWEGPAIGALAGGMVLGGIIAFVATIFMRPIRMEPATKLRPAAEVLGRPDPSTAVGVPP